MNRDKEMIDSLISWGGDLNAVNKDGYSVLDVAIRENDPEIIEHLIKSGADVNHKIRKGVNSLDLVLMDTKDQEVIVLLENAGAKRNKRISFSQPVLNTKLHTGFKDAFSVLQFEIWEPKYGIGIDIGASQRLGRLRVLTTAEDNIRYQFRETRTGFHAGIQKQFLILRINRHKRIGMNLSFDMAYFIGHNKASENPPDNLWVPMPSAGIFWRSGSWQFGGFALHQNMKNNELSTLRFGISASYRFNEMK